MKKRILSLCIALIMTLSLAACKSDDNSSKTTTQTSATTTLAVSDEVTTTVATDATITTEASTEATTTEVTTEATTTEATTTEATTTEATTTTVTEATTTTVATTQATTTTQNTPPVSVGEFEMSTMDIVKDMGLGINLGNTFESCGDWITQWGDGSVRSFETAWGSPVITKNIIQGYKNEGFDSLRIPVAWSNIMDSNYNIDPAYIARVKEVVDWALECDLYVIVNLHWDGGWLDNLPTDKENCMNKYKKIWIQISEAFKDYPEKLIFEGQNEELNWDSLWTRWSGSTEGKAQSYGLANEVNQTFVDIVRNSGGNNAKRHLLIAGFDTDIDLTCDPLFVMPTDPANRCAISVHYYTPAPFCLLEEPVDWGTPKPTWGTDAEKAELVRQFEKMKVNFVDKGIPVIIGEYGCPTKNKEVDSVRLFISSVCKEALSRNMCPMLWSVTDIHYDRINCKLYDDTLNQMMLDAKN